MATSALDRAWRDQSVWSQTANRLKRDIERRRALALGLAVVGALASAAAVSAGLDRIGGQLLVAASAVAVGFAGLVRSRADSAAVRNWTRARSVSEEIKSAVYQRLAGVGDYAGEDGDARLAERVDLIAGTAGDLLRHRLGVEPAARELPTVHDVASYSSVRIQGQIDDYYRPGAVALAAKLDRIRRSELALAGIGVVLAAVAGAVAEDAVAVWVPVVTTLGAAVGAHAAAARYDYQLVEFLRTADALERLRDRGDALSAAELVAHAEHVISIQNEGWMAKLASADD